MLRIKVRRCPKTHTRAGNSSSYWAIQNPPTPSPHWNWKNGQYTSYWNASLFHLILWGWVGGWWVSLVPYHFQGYLWYQVPSRGRWVCPGEGVAKPRGKSGYLLPAGMWYHRIQLAIGRYASYWNAFLLQSCFITGRIQLFQVSRICNID